MMKSKKIIGVFLAALLSLSMLLYACKKDDGAKDAKVTLSHTSATMLTGDELSLTAVTENTDKELSWVSSNKAVATVTGNNKTATVLAKAVGNATISVKIDDVEMATCTITVEEPVIRLAIAMPQGKLILSQTLSTATLKANIYDSTISASTLVWQSENTDVVTVEYQGATAFLTAEKAGKCNVSVTGTNLLGVSETAKIEVTVLKTVEKPDTSIKTYHAFKSNGDKSSQEFVGLSNSINELVNNPDYGTGSYIALKNDASNKLYTFGGKSYNFFTRNGVYNGFDTNANVNNGQADWWAGFYQDAELNLFANTEANMLQLSGGFKNSWYYRMSEIVTKSAGNLNNGWSGYRDSVYTAAGAGLNYATWSDDKAYDISNLELNYDLSNSYLTPSKSNQSVYAEIYLRAIVASADDKSAYYGAYFDAGTVESTASLQDGAKRSWYAYKGEMAYVHSDGMTHPLKSKITPKISEPIGYAVWNKAQGRWENSNFSVKLQLKYNFSDENEGKPFTAEYSIVGTQNETVTKVDYVFAANKTINRSVVRLTYGVSFTPDAPTNPTANDNGFHTFSQIPDLYNQGTWIGVVQKECVGFNKSAEKSNDLSFIGTGTRQYVSIWGKDVCSYKKDAVANTTTFDFKF